MTPNQLSLTEAATAVARRELTAEALLDSCLAAIDAHEHAVNATIWIDRDGAREAAAAADRAVAAGEPLGPLHGVPLAHKDMYYTAGRVSTCGSMIRGNFVPDRTATVLDRLHGAGSITFAGLNMAEFAQNPTGHNRHHGDCHNPWTCPTSPVAPPAGPAPRSPPASPSARWGRTPGAPSASPPPPAARWA